MDVCFHVGTLKVAVCPPSPETSKEDSDPGWEMLMPFHLQLPMAGGECPGPEREAPKHPYRPWSPDRCHWYYLQWTLDLPLLLAAGKKRPSSQLQNSATVPGDWPVPQNATLCG